MWWGLVCALVAAGAFGAASALQAIASRATVRGSRAVDPWLLVRVLRQWRFVAGVRFVQHPHEPTPAESCRFPPPSMYRVVVAAGRAVVPSHREHRAGPAA